MSELLMERPRHTSHNARLSLDKCSLSSSLLSIHTHTHKEPLASDPVTCAPAYPWRTLARASSLQAPSPLQRPSLQHTQDSVEERRASLACARSAHRRDVA